MTLDVALNKKESIERLTGVGPNAVNLRGRSLLSGS